MKHDQSAFNAASAYGAKDIVADRVERFVPMVRKAAWHIYGAGRDGLEVEDLMQAGFIALTECARNHEGPGEDGFAAYAKIRVRGAMFDMIRKSMPETRSTIARRKQAEEAREALRQELRREPADSELAQRLGIHQEELRQYIGEEIQLTSIDSAYDDSSADFASDLPDPYSVLSQLQDNDRLAEAMLDLPERLKLVLQLFFVEELNLTEIAGVLEVSVPRVHQLKTQALMKLRDLMQEPA